MILLFVTLTARAVYLVDAQSLTVRRRFEEGFLRTQGTLIVDAHGQVVLLRGANFIGYEGWRLTMQGMTHSEKDYRGLNDQGFNVVRLIIDWAMIEPTRGVYDEQYFLKYVDRDIAWAKKYGIYVILDMHQWNWNQKFILGGQGAPDWAVTQYPPTESGRLAAVENFWKNETLRASLVNAWKYVASRYSNETFVAGYDLLNEPWNMFDGSSEGANERWSIIQSFYEELIDAIRTVDGNHIVFVEPWLGKGYLASIRPIQKSNLVWAPHFYCYTYSYLEGGKEFESYGRPYSHANASLLESFLKPYYDQFVLDFGQPMWMGEFGIEMFVQGSDVWAQDSVTLFEKYQLGWAWWVYWRSGDPDMCLLDSNGLWRNQFLQALVNPPLTLPQ